MRDFLNSKRFKILIAILCILIGFLVAAVYNEGASSLFGNVVNTVTAPFQKLSANISDWASEFFQKYTDSAALYDENQELREEINELRSHIADYDAVKHENEQFRQIIGEMENRTDLTIKTSSVIGRDASSRFYSFTIDKGTIDGVSFLDPVMDSNGLVGYVSEVGVSSSKVRTILDVAVDVTSITSIDSKTREIGNISGSIELAEQGLCQMEYLPRDSEIEVGDYIYTSGGGGGVFPKDIYIGQVIEIHPDSEGAGLIATVKPGADIPAVKNVFVITDFEGKAQPED